MTSFEESGMTFEFDCSNCFRIENDPLVAQTSSTSTSNNMGCECVSVIDGRHCFIEAKKSAPRGPNGNIKELSLDGKPLPRNWIVFDNYRNFLREISKKFIDSLSILRSLSERRHGTERLNSIQLPQKQLNLDRIRFILIINLTTDTGNIDRQSMATLQDALKNEMRPFLAIWNIPDTSVKVVLPADAAKKLHVPVKLTV